MFSGPDKLHRSNKPHKNVCFFQITGVSILRAGETMEQALMAVCKDIRLGKILIQTNHDTGEPEVCVCVLGNTIKVLSVWQH